MNAERLARLTAAVEGARSPGEPSFYPGRVCTASMEWLDVSGAALILMSGGEVRESACVSGLGMERVEELQFSLGEGPGLDAFRLGRPVLVPDLARVGLARWPAFAPAALDAGVQALFAFPVQIGAARLGSLDLSRDRPGSLAGSEMGDVLVLARLASELVLCLQAEAPEQSLHWLLDQRDVDRALVHQATGMIAAQLEARMDVSLARLRAHAYGSDRSIYDVAGDVVARRLRFGQ